MSTVYYDKDWSIKPTHAEVIAFSSQPRFVLLAHGNASFDESLSWYTVHKRARDSGNSYTNWQLVLVELDDRFTYLKQCPNCIQDWFKHTYDLTLLLEE